MYGVLIGFSLIWGLFFVFMKWLFFLVGIWGIVFFCCLVGVIILFLFLWWKCRKVKEKFFWKVLIVVGIFNCGLVWGLIFLSEIEINSIIVFILNVIILIWIGFIGFIFFFY